MRACSTCRHSAGVHDPEANVCETEGCECQRFTQPDDIGPTGTRLFRDYVAAVQWAEDLGGPNERDYIRTMEKIAADAAACAADCRAQLLSAVQEDNDRDALASLMYLDFPRYGRWRFEYVYPEWFAYHRDDGALSVFCTPDSHKADFLDLQIQDPDGEPMSQFEPYEDPPCPRAGRTPAMVFEAVKPFLDRLADWQAPLPQADPSEPIEYPPINMGED